MHIKNKHFLVTGAGNGIGRELTLNLLTRGANVLAVDIRDEALQELTKIANKGANQLSTHVLDISDQAAVEKFAKNIVAGGQIDGLINNAGIIQPFVKINDLDFAAIEKVMNINFYGTLFMTKAFLPFLLKRPEAHIINVSSMGGFLPVPGQSVYGASKAAVKLFTEGLYAELINTNVHVTVVFPGATATNITANSGLEIPKQSEKQSKKQNFPMLPASEAANIILDGIEKNKPQIFVGKDCNLMNKLYRLNPVFATKLIAKQMKSLLS